MDYISAYVREAVSVLGDEQSTDQQLREYFDYDTWTKVYVLQDFAVQADMELDSFKFYKDKDDPLLYAGPLWDMDLSLGRSFHARYQELSKKTLWVQDGKYNGWLRRMGKHPEFLQQAETIYKEVFSPAMSDYLANVFWNLYDSTTSSMAMTAVRYDRDYSGYQEEAQSVYEWLEARKAFFDDYLDHKEDYCKVLFSFPDRNYSYMVKKGEKLNYLPLPEYGEFNDYDYEDGPIVAWADEEGNLADAEMTVTEDLQLYSVHEKRLSEYTTEK